jgi:mRNA-degrading endonuclease YafQ of YafQ-DinJ toxin-antitoxin module
MSFTLFYTPQYRKRELQFLKRHPDLKPQYGKTLEMLVANPYHPSLRLHALSGKYAGVHSISINLSYRITLELQIHEGNVILVNVGDHQAVY